MTAPLPVIELQNLSVLAGGRQFEWEAVGQGRPLVWVEGGPGLPAHLARPDVELLSRWFTCYLVNGPGCGRTSAPLDSLDGYSLPAHVEFFEDVRKALCGPTWNQALAAVIPAARYVEIADAGHLPQYEQPGPVIAAIDDWLGSVDAAAG